jgi:hypothetical protein
MNLQVASKSRGSGESSIATRPTTLVVTDLEMLALDVVFEVAVAEKSLFARRVRAFERSSIRVRA